MEAKRESTLSPIMPATPVEEVRKLIEETRHHINATRKVISETDRQLARTAASETHVLEKITHLLPHDEPLTSSLPAAEEFPQPVGELPNDYKKADPQIIQVIDWIVRTGMHEFTKAGKKIKNTPFEDFLKSLWNFGRDRDLPKMMAHCVSITEFLKQFGFKILNPVSDLYSSEIAMLSNKLGTGLRIPEEMARLGVFPEAIPPIEKMWDKIQFKETVGIDGKHHFFLVLDIDFKEWWKTQPEPLGEFAQLYLENATKFASNLKVSVGIHLKGINNRDELKKVFNLKVSDENFDSLFSTGLTRKKLEETKLFEDAGELSGSEHINRIFNLQQRVEHSPRFREMFHGWTGKRDTVKNDEIFNQAAACDEFSSDDVYDATLLLLMSGLGNEGTHSELLPDEFLKPVDDDSTHPKHYAKEMITLIDMMGFWNKKIIESGHSMGGAAKYWFINDMLERAEEFGIEKPPQLIAWAENPALRGVNIFLEKFNGMFIQTGDLAKIIADRITTNVVLNNNNLDPTERERIYDTITNDIVGGLMGPIATIFTTLRLVKETEAEYNAFIHSLVFSMISERVAVRQQTDGLVNQEDFFGRMIRRLNSHKIFLGAVTAEQDLLCATPRINGKFSEYQLTHPVMTFDGGHFTHLSPKYQEIFCRYILPLAGVLNPDEMNQVFDSLKIISPISEKPIWLTNTKTDTVNRIQYWKHQDHLQDIEMRLVPFWPEKIKNNPVLKQRTLDFVLEAQKRVYFPAISERDVLLLGVAESIGAAENILTMTKRDDGTWVFADDNIELFNRNLAQGASSKDSQRICNKVLGELFSLPEQVNVYKLN